MHLLLLGGFLGSGKTTLLMRILRRLDERGCSAAVIENEIGDIGVDTQAVKTGELYVRPLFGGCVCCQLSAGLLETVDQIQAELKPDWLAVELTGLAAMDNLREAFDRYGSAMSIHSLAIVDSTRWEALLPVCGELLQRQLLGADAVLLGKTDIAPATDTLLSRIREFVPGTPVLDINALGEALWEELSRVWEVEL